MKTSKWGQLKKRGFATILSLLAVVILTIMGTGLLSLGLRSRIYAVRTVDEIEARCAADAGLTKALYEMNEKLNVKPWSDSVLPVEADITLPNFDATYGYTVTGDVSSGYAVESTGTCGWAQRTVRCALPLKSPFDAAIFTKGDISLEGGTVVDWYNYQDGDEGMSIGTNSTKSGSIDLKNGVTINGDVVVGINGDPDVVVNKHSGATVTGEIYALSQRNQLPAIVVPSWLQGMFSGGQIKNSTTISTSGKYSKIVLGNGEKLKIDGAVILYITGDIKLDNSAGIQINKTNPEASLTLYLGGDFEGRNGSDINNETKIPGRLKIYGLDTCSKMDFKNSSDFYGAIYAPDAEVTYYNSADAYGAVVAKTFEQKNSATFNYDASLRDVTTNDDAVRFVTSYWSEE